MSIASRRVCRILKQKQKLFVAGQENPSCIESSCFFSSLAFRPIYM